MTRKIAVIVGFFVLLACSPAVSGPRTTPRETRAVNQDLAIMRDRLPDVLTSDHLGTHPEVVGALFDTLTLRGRNGETVPSVALSWELTADGRSLFFTIRHDLYFSNGLPVIASEIAYSVDLFLHPYYGTRSTALDDRRIRIDADRLDATIIDLTPSIVIIPAEYHRRLGSEFGRKPIGTGPYALVEFTPGQRIELVLRKTPHPWRKPSFTRLTIRAVSGVESQIREFRDGKDNVLLTTLDDDDFLRLRQSYLSSISRPNRVSFIAFNRPGLAEDSPIWDRRVRLALSLALTTDRPRTEQLRGNTTILDEPILPGGVYSSADHPARRSDVPRARSLLSEAGYPAGFVIRLARSPGRDPFDERILASIARDWARIGVQLEMFERPDPSPVGVLGRADGGDFSLVRLEGDDARGYGLLALYETFAQPRPWSTDSLERNLALARVTPDSMNRRELIRSALSDLGDDIAWIPLSAVSLSLAMKGGLHNLGLPDTMTTFFDFGYRGG